MTPRCKRRIAEKLLALTMFATSLDAFAAVTVGLSTSNLAPVAGGAAFSYTMSLGNDALAGASVATLVLPTNARFIGVSVAGADAGRWSCEAPGAGDNGMVACEGGILPATSAATVTVVAQFDGNMSAGVRLATARFTASGQLSETQLQQNVANNASVLTSTEEAREGRRLYRTAHLQVIGQSSLISLLHSEPLPPGAALRFMAGTSGFDEHCRLDPDANTVDCVARRLAPGAYALTLVVDMPDAMFSDGFE